MKLDPRSIPDENAREALPLTALIVHDESDTVWRAQLMLAGLAERAGIGGRLETKLWSLNLFSIPALRTQASREAAAADLILISLNESWEMSKCFKEWLHGWLDFKENRDYAIGVLRGRNRAGLVAEDSVIRWLRTFAEAAGADFFCNAPTAAAETNTDMNLSFFECR